MLREAKERLKQAFGLTEADFCLVAPGTEATTVSI